MKKSKSNPEGEKNPEFIRSLAKGLAVIEAFGREQPSMTLSEIARRAGLSPGSTRRVLVTLQTLGYIRFDRQRFSLSPRVLQLGFAYLSSLPIASLVQPQLASVTDMIDASCSVAVLDGYDVVYIARATAKRLQSDYMSVGTRLPAFATSVGKVLLAGLDDAALKEAVDKMARTKITPFTNTDRDWLLKTVRRARVDGWAVNEQETGLGQRSVAVPIRLNGRTELALGASTQVSVFSVDQLVGDYLPILQRTASEIVNIMNALSFDDRRAVKSAA